MSISVQSHDAKADAAVNKPVEATPDAPKDETPAALESQDPEQNAAEVSETEETEAKEVEDEEVAEVEASGKEAEAEESQEGEKPKKKSGFQRRVDKLNTRNAATQQEMEYWKQQALKSASATTVDAPKVDPKPAAADGKPKPDAFDTHADYVEALTDWKTEQKLNERDQKLERSRLEAEHAKTQTSFNDRLNSFKAKTEDFDDVISNLDDVPRSAAVEAILKEAENGPELLYELAKDPKEAKRIAKLPPLAAAREIGKIEARLTPKASAEKTPGTKKTTTAPDPIAPVGGGGKASAPKKTPEEYAAAGDQQGFKRAREAQLKQQRRQA